MRNFIITAAAIASLSASALGQSLNIDFGTQNGVPDPTYAGSALPGVWNAVSFKSEFPPPKIFDPVALVGLDGKPVGATVTTQGAFGTIGPIFPLEGPVGGDAALLGDGLFGQSTDISFLVHFAGLEPGVYRVVLHMWSWPADMFGVAAFLHDGSPKLPAVIAAGPWPGALTLGVTQGLHVADVTKDGTLSLEIVGAGPGSFFNGNNLIQGIQLWKIDDAGGCVTDIVPDGDTNGVDLGALLAQWGNCPINNLRGCSADFDNNSEINGIDLGILLAAWGPCKGGPVSCGSPRLGDCYAAHPAPGCGETPCCQAVCGWDPFCCSVQWDSLCAGLSNLNAACSAAVHPNCGLKASGSCFETKDSMQGCADSACCAAVCATDSFCCTFAWDSFCVEAADENCRTKKVPD